MVGFFVLASSGDLPRAIEPYLWGAGGIARHLKELRNNHYGDDVSLILIKYYIEQRYRSRFRLTSSRVPSTPSIGRSLLSCRRLAKCLTADDSLALGSSWPTQPSLLSLRLLPSTPRRGMTRISRPCREMLHGLLSGSARCLSRDARRRVSTSTPRETCGNQDIALRSAAAFVLSPERAKPGPNP